MCASSRTSHQGQRFPPKEPRLVHVPDCVALNGSRSLGVSEPLRISVLPMHFGGLASSRRGEPWTCQTLSSFQLEKAVFFPGVLSGTASKRLFQPREIVPATAYDGVDRHCGMCYYNVVPGYYRSRIFFQGLAVFKVQGHRSKRRSKTMAFRQRRDISRLVARARLGDSDCVDLPPRGHIAFIALAPGRCVGHFGLDQNGRSTD